MIKLILITFLSFAAFAGEDDEMKTEFKKDTTPTAVGDSKALTGPQKPPPVALDPRLRARIRAVAPFWIDDTTHGAAIRINKDGTFSSESQGAGAIAGQWKALKGNELEISWSDGGEKYKYPVGGSGKKLTIKGRLIKKNRVNLN